MEQPNELRVKSGEIELQVYEWPGAGRPILLAHATGFHARCWDEVVRQLPGRRVIALDFRGHGRSDKPEPPYSWPAFGDDVAAVVRALDLQEVVGVGHSKGGFAVTHAAGVLPGAFSSLLLADPVIFSREGYRVPRGEGVPHFSARRRNHWSSPEEMFERFKDRAPFNRWDRAILRDYCTYGLIAAPNGHGYVLACPPQIEAAVYAGNASGGRIYEAIDATTVPVRVLRAGPREEGAMDMSGSSSPPDLAAQFSAGVDVALPHLSHFIPMEAPEIVALHISELAGA